MIDMSVILFLMRLLQCSTGGLSLVDDFETSAGLILIGWLQESVLIG